MVYQLTNDLLTGNTIIDSEHKELFRVVNLLMDECSKGKGRSQLEPTIKFLVDYVNKHFAHEEQLQKNSNYPNMAAHHMFHENYKRKLMEIVNAIPSSGPGVKDLANMNMHIGLLVSHIKTEDKKLGSFLKK
jgi:hemerythrin